mmetsp:Transcript_92288/g.183243  ORF Transcript_92288/g.183243 Transcript_92288/m.183243 type:complete len:216 (+) Transcript_92288:787-1434(+)
MLPFLLGDLAEFGRAGRLNFEFLCIAAVAPIRWLRAVIAVLVTSCNASSSVMPSGEPSTTASRSTTCERRRSQLTSAMARPAGGLNSLAPLKSKYLKIRFASAMLKPKARTMPQNSGISTCPSSFLGASLSKSSSSFNSSRPSVPKICALARAHNDTASGASSKREMQPPEPGSNSHQSCGASSQHFCLWQMSRNFSKDTKRPQPRRRQAVGMEP